MNDVLYAILSFLMMYHMQLLFGIIGFGSLKFRKHGVIALIVLLSVYCAFPRIYSFINGEEFWVNTYSRIGWYNFSYILYWFFLMAIFYLSFQTTLKKVVYYGLVSYTLESFSQALRGLIRSCFFNEERTLLWLIISLFVSFLLLCIYYLFGVRRLKKESFYMPDNIYLIVFSFIILFAVNIFSQYWQLNTQGGNYDVVDVFGSVYLALCTLTLLLLQFGVFAESNLKRENEIMERVITESGKQREISQKNVDIINRKCHDLKHQINAMRLIFDEKEREKGLSEIENAISVYDSSIKTGNKILDVLLTEKTLYCEQYGITFSCLADAKCLNFMNASDIYSLFGNAIDNAFESVSKIEDKDSRQVSLNVYEKQNYIYIRIDNSCEDIVLFEGGLPAMTTKADKNYHGFGTKSIKFVAEKYSGKVDMELENGIFSVCIILPVQKKK